MSYLSLTFLILYFLVLVLLAVYGLHRYLMVFLYYKYKRRAGPSKAETLQPPYPTVTVQLPLYNERYVVERLIDAVCRIDYPKDRLEVQVLDDSTDETAATARACVDRYRARGFDIHHIHRTHRTGFKAGALREGLARARGTFVAIFDADFIPPPDILRRTLPAFADERVGMVQTRWGYLNREYSLLTQAQAIMLDGHFVMEHGARARSGRFFNFNGTGGIWRRQCIDGAGGWQHDTLTEDLDLSYRAQLAGQRFIFLEKVVTPSELPVEMNAFKSQQHRWSKGSIQTARKLLPMVWRSGLPFRIKLEAAFHLTNNIAYLLMLMLSVLMFPAIVIRVQAGWIRSFWIDLPFLLAATASILLFYLCAEREVEPARWRRRILYLPFLMSIGIGICVNNARAVMEALVGHWTEFQRTPKYGIRGKEDPWQRTAYRGVKTWLPALELLFAFHFGLLIYYTAVNRIYSSLPFLCLFFLGFLYVGLASLWPSGSRVTAKGRKGQ
jgi:cellulose synthase/poly-beta-1,6-N-acetylglucosamine synthase-like glycosyltransferase